MAARILVALAIVAALVAIALATGWADDKAPPGTRGRVPVTTTSP